MAVREATAAAHEQYLRFAEAGTRHLSEMMAFQQNLATQAFVEPDAVVPASEATARPILDTDMCREFAIGSIAKVLGPSFAPVDGHPTRVRLPDGPLMLVDHIWTIEGEPRSLTSGRVVTDHLVHEGRWYIQEGPIPAAIAVEAGQADLFLSGYLGIDFATKGLAVYRLLDAAVTFHRALPRPGELIRYDIRIERFFRQGETHLFRFRFEGTVNGEPLLTMTNGCAGFFTAAELASGKGIVQTALDKQPIAGKRPDDWHELAKFEAIEQYSERQLVALRGGDLPGCFGTQFGKLDVADPLTVPDGMLKLVDRVTEIDPHGGRFGLGRIRAEMDIHPDDWFLTCHFVDDQVMPGTLMYECCLHTLRVFLLRLGWAGEKATVSWEPLPGVASQLKCRGQVVASTKVVTYEVSLKEIGYRPEPYALADALMYADGKPIVEILNMTLRLCGSNRDEIERRWRKSEPLTPLFDRARILAFTVGNPSEAFGERYRVFDSQRVIARLPGPPFMFLNRITKIQNCQPWHLAAGGEIEAVYDVPRDAWYFAANRQPTMPFAVLLEVALQPCGWLSAYLGSALTSEDDMAFRNLGGQGIQHALVGPDAGTLTTRVKITNVSTSGGMIIQHFDFCVLHRDRTVYKGTTYFGFFTRTALANQIGLREVAPYQPTLNESARAERFPFPQEAPFPDSMLRMVDEIDVFISDGGSAGLGFIRASKRINPDEWFFKAHFYQDPVWPGSLGLEAFIQLLKVVAGRRWSNGREPQFLAPDEKHEWVYRGQVVPANQLVMIEAVVLAIDDGKRQIRAAGLLSVDGRPMYQMKGFTLQA